MAISVVEASEAYQSAMRNIAPDGPDVCSECRTFIGSGFSRCHACNQLPDYLASIVPITYSEAGGQVHTALRGYKDWGTPETRRQQMTRLAAVLWRFLREHEPCIAGDTGVNEFNLATTVPSSTRQSDAARGNQRTYVGWIRHLEGRFKRLLLPAANAPAEGRYQPDRYECTEDLQGEAILLIDDTWTTGGHAQSAAKALLEGGAGTVALVVIGRHIRRDWDIGDGTTSGARLDAIPSAFDWSTCAVHGASR